MPNAKSGVQAVSAAASRIKPAMSAAVRTPYQDPHMAGGIPASLTHETSVFLAAARVGADLEGAGRLISRAETATSNPRPRKENEPMSETNAANAKLIQYLVEAYGKERELERSLQAHIAMNDRKPYKKRLQEHLRETKRHAKLVEQRARKLGAGGLITDAVK